MLANRKEPIDGKGSRRSDRREFLEAGPEALAREAELVEARIAQRTAFPGGLPVTLDRVARRTLSVPLRQHPLQIGGEILVTVKAACRD
jgi:hypothetical protein